MDHSWCSDNQLALISQCSDFFEKGNKVLQILIVVGDQGITILAL